jgi:DNA processing protein
VYPDRHVALFDEIVVAGGGLLSEYGPGTPPRPGQFPARNRLVAALASVVVVGESRARSGALITARMAIKMGRTLLAIPGSPGTDDLLARGAAAPVESAADVLEAVAGRPAHAAAVAGPFDDLLRALGELGDEPVAADVLAGRMGLSLADTLGLLCEAELRGVVGRLAGARFEARSKSKIEASRGH